MSAHRRHDPMQMHPLELDVRDLIDKSDGLLPEGSMVRNRVFGFLRAVRDELGDYYDGLPNLNRGSRSGDIVPRRAVSPANLAPAEPASDHVPVMDRVKKFLGRNP